MTGPSVGATVSKGFAPGFMSINPKRSPSLLQRRAPSMEQRDQPPTVMEAGDPTGPPIGPGSR